MSEMSHFSVITTYHNNYSSKSNNYNVGYPIQIHIFTFCTTSWNLTALLILNVFITGIQKGPGHRQTSLLPIIHTFEVCTH